MIDEELKSKRYKPIIKWAGGKSWLVKKLAEIIPEKYNNYHEPFLGGGASFFNLKSNPKAYLSDTNDDLINFFNQIKNNYQQVLLSLSKFEVNSTSYYEVRDSNFISDIDKAAKFYYLNQTCFNGLYRVNRQGKFNVPFGRNDIINLGDAPLFARASKALSNCEIKCCDFEVTLNSINENDLVFLDPPYTVAHNLNGFIDYNKKLFCWADQERLANYINCLIEKKAYFILTNANHKSTVALYKDLGKISEVNRFSTIGGKAESRKLISEIIVTNCP